MHFGIGVLNSDFPESESLSFQAIFRVSKPGYGDSSFLAIVFIQYLHKLCVLYSSIDRCLVSCIHCL